MDLVKKSRGRQKIEMKLIECENSRAVTFSKRKRTLFNKAKRFSSSTGSTIAMFFTSSKGFMHAFGSSCLHSIINEYRARRRNMESLNLHHLLHQQQQLRVGPILNMQLDQERDPVDKLKEILECQDISSLIGSFDPSNVEHIKAAYNMVQSCCIKVQKQIEQLSASSVNPTIGFDLNIEPSIEDGENGGVRPSFDLNVVPVGNDDMVCVKSSNVNQFEGFNLNVGPSGTNDETIRQGARYL